MAPPVGLAFLRKSHGGCDSPPDCRQEPPFESNGYKIKRRTEVRRFSMAPPVGLEPTTCGLTVRRSTD